ncbi:MAG: GNAT family N-acetyltransferase [Chloroflexi bacterium]|nr:GNAT family N-acetyltransferase [Chloroflexota bacterium]
MTVRALVPDDLDAVHAVLTAGFGEQPLAARRAWLDWAMRNTDMLAHLSQPPLGDRAVVLKATGEVIGVVGLVPSYGPFGKLPHFRAMHAGSLSGGFTLEMGLFWALSPQQRGHGYATEAAHALVTVMFTQQALARFVAMTDHNNTPSIAVMQRLGMVINHNPDPDPVWFQVVGILENPHLS